MSSGKEVKMSSATFPSIYFLTSEDFNGPNFILERIVSVCLFEGKGCIRIVSPAPAEVEAFVDPSNSVFPADP